jgi:3-dehydroquinate synthase
MVDACVGGKAAVNLSFGKNLVGCFKQPILVVCDPELVLILSKLELFNRMAEIIKYASLFCEDFLNFLNSCHEIPRIYEIETMVYKSLLFKKKVVEFDEFDKKNERIKLNFGHTIGHPVETFYRYKKIKHGQAV